MPMGLFGSEDVFSKEITKNWSTILSIIHSQSLVVEAEGAVRVLEEGMGGQHGVVRLNHGGGHLGRWGHRE